MFKIVITSIFLSFGVFLASIQTISAQESEQAVLIQDITTRYKAKVVSIGEQYQNNIPGTDVLHTYQTISAIVLNKDKKGEIVEVENDYSLLAAGDVFYLDYTRTGDGQDMYYVGEIYRIEALVWLALFFFVLVLVLGGMQGLRSLLALAGSFLAIVYILFPGILAGYNPILISGTLAIGILFFIMYVTHGFNRMTTAAFLGCFVTILITIGLSYLAVFYTKLTGFSSDDAVYLNVNTEGSINFKGLLLGAIIIGVMGIIDDIAITQASVVAELRALTEKLTNKQIFVKAMNIGKAHMGAVVNSLVLAYTGTALPLLLLVYISDIPTLELINQEVIATEIVRTLVGSIGLVLAVPISTIIAVIVIKKGIAGGHHHGHSHQV
ncbi:MAG: hypothetical protein RI996_366 [Candidatus Parcubacteria bacterium]|jgi:uncharacterized membrane protein